MRFQTAVFLGLMLFQSAVHANEKLSFITFPIPSMVINSNEGKFIELTKAVAEKAGIDIAISVYPAKRAQQFFLSQQADAIFPALDSYFPNKHPHRSQELLMVKRIYIFSKKDQPIYKSMDELEGKRIGTTLGYTYADTLKHIKDTTIDQADSDESNAQKLARGWIDAFLVEEWSGLKAFENTSTLNQVHYDVNSPISSFDVYYAFQPSLRGKRIAETFDRVLRQMKEDGSYQVIMQNTSPSSRVP
ncbi:MAG: transporter substrate-binding domain-containing protein [Hahellaceae bacterium]|nr:transporter substrate-binding domain-containing protein [Hahellaceae bacterium]MCP5212334.1 transporter substrate-binding domain-containing protein [Hahellaceae bacterium]